MKKIIKQKITLEKLHSKNNDGKSGFLIHLDENFKHLLSMSYGFHLKVLESASKKDKKEYKDSDSFIDIIGKLCLKESFSILTNSEIKMFSNWLESITQMMLEVDRINLKDIDIKKFFKLSQSFFKEFKKENI